MIQWLRNLLFRGKVIELKEIENKLLEAISREKTVYTTIRSFKGMNQEYYSWVSTLISTEQYKFLLFDLRENVIREMTNDKNIQRCLGRIDMISIIDNYLKTYKRDYEEEFRRDTER
ncbi:MAG: hypothetical protein JXB48_21225 [Candidatus Latescibacteria bacterium]|nr:hypothetical protein [Candidatus Latescibacterota bacterium]